MYVNNRRCIRKLGLRTFRAARKRNRIAVLAIALTALLFTSLFTILLSINSSYEQYSFRQAGGFCHGTFKEVTQEDIQAIAAHPKVKAAGQRLTIGFISSGVFGKVPAELSFMDENCAKWSYAQPEAGRLPQSGNEIAMDTAALALLGIPTELGAQIPLSYTVGDQTQLTYEKQDTFTLVGYWAFDDISPVHYINVSEEYAQAVEQENLSEGGKTFRRDLNVMLASGVNIRGQMEQVLKDLGKENSLRFGVNWGYTAAQLGETLDASAALAIVAFLALVVFTGYLIIYNIFQISVMEDIRFYGLLKTIGVTPRQLRRIIRQQALLLCAFGIPLGLLPGYGVGVLLMPKIMANTTFGAKATALSASPWIFLASSLFALFTVLLSCSRPGRMAAGVSPVEAAKYTEGSHRKRRRTRGAGVAQMALANLGRSRGKTVLVVLSLSLALVLLQLLVTFTGGFDLEVYLKKQTCADFIVSTTDYFRFNSSDSYLSPEQLEQIRTHTVPSLSGCGYQYLGAVTWESEAAWKAARARFDTPVTLEAECNRNAHRGELVADGAQIEGLDRSLFEKLTLAEGDLAPLFGENSPAIALVVDTDDYGRVSIPEGSPPLGTDLTVTYVDETGYIDRQTGKESNETTLEENLQLVFRKSHDVTYRVCAYVTVPHSMSYRYRNLGLSLVLPVEKLAADSGKSPVPLFYLFDTQNRSAEEDAERYLAELTAGDLSPLMYESKATLRAEFRGFQSMFLLLGGMLCTIIGLVGILNFLNAMMTGILSRRREFAVLQAVGMTGRQLKQMLICEGLFYTLASAVIALVLSLLLEPLVGSLLEHAFWFFRLKSNFLPVLCAIPAFALLGWCIPSVLCDHAAKHSIVEQLREAE